MNDVPLREFIERMIADNNLRRDDLRKEDNRRLTEYIESTEKALQLQANAYPKISDFNELKARVDVGAALWKVIAALFALAGLIFAGLTYAK